MSFIFYLTRVYLEELDQWRWAFGGRSHPYFLPAPLSTSHLSRGKESSPQHRAALHTSTQGLRTKTVNQSLRNGQKKFLYLQVALEGISVPATQKGSNMDGSSSTKIWTHDYKIKRMALLNHLPASCFSSFTSGSPGVRLLGAVTNTITKSNSGEKGLFLSYTSRSQSITEGIQGRNSRKELE